MKITVSAQHLTRSIIYLTVVAFLPLLLTQCKSTGGSYKEIEYDPSTLNTPSGHGMEKRDYPFDDNGRYRKDWVKNKSTGKTRSASKIPETEMVSASEVETETVAEASTVGYYGPAEGPASNQTDSVDLAVVATTSAPVVSEASYHKVVSGDTLYSLSRRYGTSVDELKRMNGLSNNTIRTGQSLRLP